MWWKRQQSSYWRDLNQNAKSFVFETWNRQLFDFVHLFFNRLINSNVFFQCSCMAACFKISNKLLRRKPTVFYLDVQTWVNANLRNLKFKLSTTSNKADLFWKQWFKLILIVLVLVDFKCHVLFCNCCDGDQM